MSDISPRFLQALQHLRGPQPRVHPTQTEMHVTARRHNVVMQRECGSTQELVQCPLGWDCPGLADAPSTANNYRELLDKGSSQVGHLGTAKRQVAGQAGSRRRVHLLGEGKQFLGSLRPKNARLWEGASGSTPAGAIKLTSGNPPLVVPKEPYMLGIPECRKDAEQKGMQRGIAGGHADMHARLAVWK
jgi:hypothetical protein